MTKTLCKLVIVCPQEVAEDIIEAFLDASPSLPGFTSFDVEGHGHDFASASTSERVRGHVARKCLWMILPEAEVGRALDALKQGTSNPHVTHWLEPVAGAGSLTSW
ncbi:MAG: DUF3240 family protein [Oceanospirillaceae bacterium]|nr:DUF3240 family protein [Oceanospirillaceae bacterium]